MSRPLDVDDALIEGIRSRSDEAFAVLYRTLASDLLSFASGMLRDRGAAEDAVQQAFLELARAAHTIKGDGRSLRAWMYRSVRFSCLDEVRRRKRRPEEPTETLPDTGREDTGLPDPVVQEALLRLSDRHRAIVVLRHVIGCSVDEIAEILDTNRTAIYAASKRAERRLATELTNVESALDAASQQMKDHDTTGGTT